MDNGDNSQKEDIENTSNSKEKGVTVKNQIEEKDSNEEESIQLSHREAMGIWKEGLAEMIEVCILTDPSGEGKMMHRVTFFTEILRKVAKCVIRALPFEVLDPPMYAEYVDFNGQVRAGK